MKKLISILLAIVICAALAACSGTNGAEKATTVHTPMATKPSPDKYTYYLKDYVGRNCASFGFGWGSQIGEKYGSGTIYFNIITNDGSYVDVNDKNSLSQYIVTGQSVEPNTEIKYVFKVSSDGKELRLIDTQSLEEVDLYVTRVKSETNTSISENELASDIDNETPADETSLTVSEKKTTNNQGANKPVTINTSPDKYTWYIKDYSGKNCAAIGYTSLGGDRRDKYGNGNVKLVFLSQDKGYIDIENEDILKNYVITGQNLEPNTELKYTFEIDENGEELDYSILHQNYEEITLTVKKIGEDTDNTVSLTKIKPSPDKYTYYISDYTGKNLANFGYVSLGGDKRDSYGNGNIKFNLIVDDGSFIDFEDNEEVLQNYYVTGQSIEPNTEIKFKYRMDDGKELDYSIESQTIEEMDLYVSHIESIQ